MTVVADVDRVTEKKDGKYADIRRFTVEQLSYALKSGYKFENVEYHNDNELYSTYSMKFSV